MSQVPTTKFRLDETGLGLGLGLPVMSTAAKLAHYLVANDVPQAVASKDKKIVARLDCFFLQVGTTEELRIYTQNIQQESIARD